MWSECDCRDLQLLKEYVFRGLDTTIEMLQVLIAALAKVEFVDDRLNAAMTPELYATERAYELVLTKGIPFRDAYKIVAAEFLS